MRFACWITKAADTHPEYVLLIAFARQKWLHKTRLSVMFIGTLPVLFKKNEEKVREINRRPVKGVRKWERWYKYVSCDANRQYTARKLSTLQTHASLAWSRCLLYVECWWISGLTLHLPSFSPNCYFWYLLARCSFCWLPHGDLGNLIRASGVSSAECQRRKLTAVVWRRCCRYGFILRTKLTRATDAQCGIVLSSLFQKAHCLWQ